MKRTYIRWLLVLVVFFLLAGTLVAWNHPDAIAQTSTSSQPSVDAARAQRVSAGWFEDVTWRPVWLAPGDETGNLYGMSAPDSNTIIAVGASGLVYRSEDGGTSWALQFTGSKEDLFDVHFFDTQRGVAVGAGGLIFRTGNGGLTWQTVTSGTTEELKALTFVDAQNGWAVGNAGTILHSSDGGQTWAAQTSGVSSPLFGVSFADPQNGWAVGANGVVLHTSDGGATWTRQNAGTIDELRDVLAVSASEAWLVGRGGTVRHTTDGGTTWAPFDLGTKVILAAVEAAPDGSVWIGAADGKVYHITDPAQPATSASIGETQFVYDLAFLNGNTLVAAGSNWLNISDRPWGGMFIARSQDGGNTWHLVMKSICQLVDIAQPQQGRLWAVGQSCERRRLDEGHILMGSTDGGRTWFLKEIQDAKRKFTVVDFGDAQHGIVSGHGTEWNTVLGTQPSTPGITTNDGGTSWTYRNLIEQYSDWTSIYGPVPGNNVYAGKYLPNGRIWLGGHYGIVHTSADFGQTWQHIDLNDTGRNITNVEIFAVEARPSGRVWLADKAGRIILSPDNGLSWRAITMERYAGSSPTIEAIQFVDDNRGWAVGYRGVVWKTTRGGQQLADWKLLTMPADLANVAWQDVYFFDDQFGILVGGECLHRFCEFTTDFTQGAIAVTYDGGASWLYEFVPDVKVFYGIAAYTPDDVYIVGEKGAIFHYPGLPTRLNAFPLSSRLTIDGNLADWPTVVTATLRAGNASYLTGATVPSPDDISAVAQALWYAESPPSIATELYLGFTVTDDVVTQGDTLIVGLDSDNSQSPTAGDHVLTITPDGTVTENGVPSSDVVVEVRRTAQGYTVEMLLDGNYLVPDGRLSPDQVIGISFALRDDDGSGEENYLVSDGRDPATPSRDFGTITLFGDQLTLRRGANSYSRVGDAYINRERPDDNYGEYDEWGIAGRLRAGWNRFLPGETRSILLSFDLSFLPPEAEITYASLHLYTPFKSPSNLQMDVAVYGLLRPWTEREVTWNRAAEGMPWDTPGANGEGTDRDATPEDVRTLDSKGMSVAWDVRGIAQRILEGRAHGFLLRPIAGNTNGFFTFLSSEEESPNLQSKRPYLMLSYRLEPRPLPTPTPTPTPSPTPTATSTPTPTPTPTPTSTPTPTPTPVPTLSTFVPFISR